MSTEQFNDWFELRAQGLGPRFWGPLTSELNPASAAVSLGLAAPRASAPLSVLDVCVRGVEGWLIRMLAVPVALKHTELLGVGI